MGKCKNCNIEILDATDCCPLCQSILEQTEDLENMYPDVRFYMRRMTFFSRIYLFCGIVLEAVLFGLNLLVNSEIWWSAITGLILLYIYMVLRYAILGQSGYQSKVIILSLISVLSAFFTVFVYGKSLIPDNSLNAFLRQRKTVSKLGYASSAFVAFVNSLVTLTIESLGRSRTTPFQFFPAGYINQFSVYILLNRFY